jgi:hypothetical protein
MHSQADDGANARALVASDLRRVRAVEDVVRERQDVAGGVAGASIRHGVRCRVLDHVDHGASVAARMARLLMLASRMPGARVHDREDEERRRCGG